VQFAQDFVRMLAEARRVSSGGGPSEAPRRGNSDRPEASFARMVALVQEVRCGELRIVQEVFEIVQLRGGNVGLP
jgi:hypothetical protein